MNNMSNQEILDNCDAFTVSNNSATEAAKRCCLEVMGQVSRVYGPNAQLSDVGPVIEELLLSMACDIHRTAFNAGEQGPLLPGDRRVKSQMMTWAGLPVWVDGIVTAAPENWPLIDAHDTAPKPPGQAFPDQATCTQNVQVGIGTAAA